MNRAEHPRSAQTNEKSHLAARGAGKQLAQRDERREILRAQPVTLLNVLAIEIAEMCNRPAERCQAELQGHAQDLDRRAFRV